MAYLWSKLNQFDQFYKWSLSISDPRLSKWTLMSGFSSTWFFTGLYVALVIVGKRIMRSLPAFQFRWTLFFYNGILVALNWHIFSELLIASWRLGYSYLCQPVNYSDDPDELRIAKAIWWYYISKLVEFMDTFFFILRKKNNQISFLHVYHHASMFPIWWIGVKWIAGGSAFFGPLINSFIHVVMYTYYGIAALGPKYHKYLWWKKYLTKLQLTQFVVGMLFGAHMLATDCRAIPLWMQYTGLAYGVSMITLFLNFYYHEYVVRAARHLHHHHSSASSCSSPSAAAVSDDEISRRTSQEILSNGVTLSNNGHIVSSSLKSNLGNGNTKRSNGTKKMH